MVQVDSRAAFGLPTPYYVARKFTRCHSRGRSTLGTRLLSLIGSLVELTLTQQSVDQSYQLAGREHACPLVMVRGGLAVFGLVVCRILLVVHSKRVRVNGRATYWGSHAPIPGGVAFENFELIQRFTSGEESWFGVTLKTPREMGWTIKG